MQGSPNKEELKEYGRLSRFAASYDELLKLDMEIEQTAELVKSDSELSGLARDELKQLESKRRDLLLKLVDFIGGGDDAPSSGIIMELRPGAGGDEAAIFAHDLLRLYIKFIESKKWPYQTIEVSHNEHGGIRYASLSIDSPEAYQYLKFEAGAHRVQRVPKTEASGRIHTSVVTVAVLAQASEVELNIKKEDLEIETKRSGGAGGQHVNKTESAVRMKHKPTGIVVECESDRSQIRNRELAYKVLCARVYAHLQQERKAKEASLRRQQIGSGERSEKIRTYNFMQNRVTDHRINHSIYELEKFMDGSLHLMTDELIKHEREQKLRQLVQG